MQRKILALVLVTTSAIYAAPASKFRGIQTRLSRIKVNPNDKAAVSRHKIATNGARFMAMLGGAPEYSMGLGPVDMEGFGPVDMDPDNTMEARPFITDDIECVKNSFQDRLRSDDELANSLKTVIGATFDVLSESLSCSAQNSPRTKQYIDILGGARDTALNNIDDLAQDPQPSFGPGFNHRPDIASAKKQKSATNKQFAKKMK